jgi:hypothetical protein
MPDKPSIAADKVRFAPMAFRVHSSYARCSVPEAMNVDLRRPSSRDSRTALDRPPIRTDRKSHNIQVPRSFAGRNKGNEKGFGLAKACVLVSHGELTFALKTDRRR